MSGPQQTHAGAKHRRWIKTKVFHCFVCSNTQYIGAIHYLTSLDHAVGSARTQYLTTWSPADVYVGWVQAQDWGGMELHSSCEGTLWVGDLNSTHIHPGKATHVTDLTGINRPTPKCLQE